MHCQVSGNSLYFLTFIYKTLLNCKAGMEWWWPAGYIGHMSSFNEYCESSTFPKCCLQVSELNNLFGHRLSPFIKVFNVRTGKSTKTNELVSPVWTKQVVLIIFEAPVHQALNTIRS